MKLSEGTLEVLNNFSTINPSIVFNEGKQLRTMAPTKGCVAYAKIDDDVPSTFGIFNLSQFLSVMALFNTPDCTVLDKSMVISEGGESINYVFADPSMIVAPPEKEIQLPAPEISFDLSNDNLKRILKVTTTLGSPEIAVDGDGSKITIKAVNVKNSSDNSYSVEIGETDKKFRMVFSLDDIKLLPRDYKVEISSKGISKFEADNITYYVVVQQKSSKYEG